MNDDTSYGKIWAERIEEEIPDLQERIAYWQAQGSQAIFDAAWELVVAKHEREHGCKPGRLQKGVTRGGREDE